MKPSVPILFLSAILLTAFSCAYFRTAALAQEVTPFPPGESGELLSTGTPVPDSDYTGFEADAPTLYDIFRRFVITDTPTPLVTAIVTEAPRPTKTPRPTPTPVFIPPTSDPDYIRLMIAFGVFTVGILLLGVWLNRRHLY